MPALFIIPLAIVGLAITAGVIGVICEIAYEQGYDDACRDWRGTVLYSEAHDVIEAEVVEEWPAWTNPPSYN